MNQLISKKVLGRPASEKEAPVILDEYANTSSAGSIIAFHLYHKDINQNELGIICSFGYILPKKIINLFKYGIINFHSSILPQYGGAHPIFWTIRNGENKTGITIHYITEKIDNGPLIKVEEIKINPNDDRSSISLKLMKLSMRNILKLIFILSKTRVKSRKEIINVKIWPKRIPSQSQISWSYSNEEVKNFIRAMTNDSLDKNWPFPFIMTNKKKIKITKKLNIEQIQSLRRKYKN